VVKEYFWSTDRKTLAVTADNEIEAALLVRAECVGRAEEIYSVTLREGQKVYA
jgi:hypothetical protein